MIRILYYICPRYNSFLPLCMISSESYIAVCVLLKWMLSFFKERNIVFYFLLIVELNRGCPFTGYNIMLCLGSILRRSLNSSFHIMPASLRPTQRVLRVQVRPLPAPAQNPSVASFRPLDRIQTPGSPECPEGCFVLYPPLKPFPLLSMP